MSWDMEKIFTQLQEFIDQELQGRIPTPEELDQLTTKFMQKYNYDELPDEPLTEENAVNVLDYLELADQAKSKKKRKEYLEKALALEPEDINLQYQLLEEETDTPLELLEKLQPLIKKAKEQLKTSGIYRDAKGYFWGVLETRPYMQLLQTRLECLKNCNMIGTAVRLAQEMLKLNPNDNQGIRYSLMALYAYQEDEFHAKRLMQKYRDDKDSAFFLLPLSILYFKLDQWPAAEKYLNQLKEKYKITTVRKFVHAVNKEDYATLNDFPEWGYQPYKFSELQEVFAEDNFLIVPCHAYFEWAEKKLKPVRKKKK